MRYYGPLHKAEAPCKKKQTNKNNRQTSLTKKRTNFSRNHPFNKIGNSNFHRIYCSCIERRFAKLINFKNSNNYIRHRTVGRLCYILTITIR